MTSAGSRGDAGPTPTTVGFIGLGAMGAPMAANLATSGVRMLVHDADPGRSTEIARQTGARAADLAEVARDAEVVITMLPSSDVVEAVLTGSDGMLSSLRPGALILDMSSSDPMRTRALGVDVARAGGRLVDAPVSGGVSRAVSGDLAIMVGGDPEHVAAAQPLLAAMGSSVVRTGELGSAHAMKALNNLCSAGGFLIGVEVLVIGKAFGLEPDLMVDVLNASTGMNNSTQRKFKQFVLSGSYGSAFGLDLLVKDLRIALSVASAQGVAVPFAEQCLAQWEQGRAALGPARDHTEMARHSESLAGVSLHP